MIDLPRLRNVALLAGLCACSGSDDAPPPVAFSSTTPGVIQGGDNAVAWTVTGWGFQTGATITVDLPGVTVNNLVIVSDTQVTFELTAPAGVAAGTANVALFNPDQTSAGIVVPTVPQVVMLSTHVQPIFTLTCVAAGCHAPPSPAMGLDLSAGMSHAELVGVPSVREPSILLVAAGNPGASYIFDEIVGSLIAAPMTPMNTGGLNATDLMLIWKWIEAGALDN